jgi:hypothetical protein
MMEEARKERGGGGRSEEDVEVYKHPWTANMVWMQRNWDKMDALYSYMQNAGKSFSKAKGGVQAGSGA